MKILNLIDSLKKLEYVNTYYKIVSKQQQSEHTNRYYAHAMDVYAKSKTNLRKRKDVRNPAFDLGPFKTISEAQRAIEKRINPK